MRFTTLTLPNKASVDGCTSFRMAGASSDSVLRALMTSEGPSGVVSVVIMKLKAQNSIPKLLIGYSNQLEQRQNAFLTGARVSAALGIGHLKPY